MTRKPTLKRKYQNNFKRSISKTATNEFKTINADVTIACEYRDIHTGEIFLDLEFQTAAGPVSITILRGELDDRKLLSKLLNIGYRGDRSTWNKVKVELLKATPKSKTKTSRRTGYFDGTLILRYQNLIRSSPEYPSVEFLNSDGKKGEVAVKMGTSEGFCDAIAQALERSPILVISYLAALIAPLLCILKKEVGLGILLYGETSTGKSTALKLAQSIVTKTTSDSGLTSFADTTGHLLKLIRTTPGIARSFGDIKANRNSNTLTPDLVAMTYAADEGRMRKTQDNPEDYETIGPCVLLFSAENPLWLMSGGKRIEKSDLARLIHIPVPCQQNGGIFASDPDNSLEHIRETTNAMKQNHGAVYRRWVKYLLSCDPEVLRKDYDQLFNKTVPGLEDRRGSEQRIVDKFKMLRATAMIADKCGLLPISRKSARLAIVDVCADALDTLAHIHDNHSLSEPIVDLKLDVLQQLCDTSNFPTATIGSELKLDAAKHLGFQRKNGSVSWLFINGIFLAGRFPSANPNKVLSILHGLIKQGLGTKPTNGYTHKVAQKGISDFRAYKLSLLDLKQELNNYHFD